MEEKRFLVQRTDHIDSWVSLMTESELIEYVNMSDCHDEDWRIYDVSVYGEIKPIFYAGWQPDCLIEFINSIGQVVLSGYGTDH